MEQKTKERSASYIDALVCYGPCELTLSGPSRFSNKRLRNWRPFSPCPPRRNRQALPWCMSSFIRGSCREAPRDVTSEVLDVDTRLYKHLASKGRRWADEDL